MATNLIDFYSSLIIKQYFYKPKAQAEIKTYAGNWQDIWDCIQSFGDAFDLDLAVGEQLDVIGKLVGIDRLIPITDEILNDDDYRFFIKLKIANNNVRATMSSDEGISLQEAINLAFNGQAIVTDNKDMSLTLTVPPGFDLTLLDKVLELKLLPKPQGVRYNQVIISVPNPFGFKDQNNTKGFGKVGNPNIGGPFARMVQ